MQKSTAKLFTLLLTSLIFSSGVAYADQCPSNQACSNNMPIVPEFKNPLATNSIQSQNNTNVTVPQITNNNTNSTANEALAPQTLSVPVIPTTTQKVEIPNNDVPVLKAPDSVINGQSTAQSIPTITVPEFSWPDKIVDPAEKSDVTPAYPTPNTQNKNKNKNKNIENTPKPVIESERVNPLPALPNNSDNSSSNILSQIFILGLGAVMAISYNAIKQRAQAIKNK